jgi:hypothetical protein
MTDQISKRRTFSATILVRDQRILVGIFDGVLSLEYNY